MIKSIDKKPTDEKNEQNLRILERFTLVSDDDGHKYIIPVARKLEFDAWLRATEDSDFSDPGFDEFRIDGGLLTFTDPKVNR